MKPLIVIARENPASANMRDALLRLARFQPEGEGFWRGEAADMEEYPGSIVEIVPSREAGCYIFASTHKSQSGKPCFTAHTPGNWGAADLGGEAHTLDVACASRLAAAAREMQKLSSATLGWETCIEADHHGPSLRMPALFVEIGSTEKEWGNAQAGEIAAQGVMAAASAVIAPSAWAGFGGTHYAPKFGPMILGGTAAIGHVISGYALERDGVDEERVRQAMEKNEEKAEGALLDWKGIKGARRAELVALLDKMGVAWKKA